MSPQSVKRLKRIGQSTSEYAVLLAIVALALITMQLYIKRGIQGRIRELAVQLAPGNSPSGAAQYESPKTSNYTTQSNGVIIEQSDSLNSQVYQDDVTERWGDENVQVDIEE